MKYRIYWTSQIGIASKQKAKLVIFNKHLIVTKSFAFQNDNASILRTYVVTEALSSSLVRRHDIKNIVRHFF